MKIVFTGGGTGGHFYPIIAVAQKVNKIIDRDNILATKLYYISDSPYDKEMLFENGLVYEEVSTGKMRVYFSMKNFTDLFKIFFGCINATWKLFTIYPDVVFGKGGYGSFPVMFAARLLRIPVIIHESDSAPGRVNAWAGKFSKRVAVSFKEAAEYFPAGKVAWTGLPLRSEIERPAPKEEALQYFKLESNIPTLVILGGSQGAELINNTIIDALPKLVANYQIIHQTGIKNFQAVVDRADVVLSGNANKLRYKPMAFLNPLDMKMASGAASLIISRSGGSAIFEIAAWGLPSVLIPISKTNMDHQRKNAFNYARAGACSVIEEMNMTANILISEVDRIMSDPTSEARMIASAKAFNKPDAAMKIAEALVELSLSHEAR